MQKKNLILTFLQETLHATHLMKLLDKMHEYEMDPTRTVGATERTRDGWTDWRTDRGTDRRMDRLSETNIPPTTLCAEGIIISVGGPDISMPHFRVRSYVPRVLCSPGPMFPRTYVPRVRCSPILCSPVPMFPGTCEPLSYVPRYLCSPVLCSPVPMFPVPMFPGTYVPPYLCSPVSPLTIMPSTYVPHP